MNEEDTRKWNAMVVENGLSAARIADLQTENERLSLALQAKGRMTITPHRTRGWNKREVPRVHVTVRFEPSELAEIDAARSDMTRQEWIYGLTLAHARRVNRNKTK